MSSLLVFMIEFLAVLGENSFITLSSHGSSSSYSSSIVVISIFLLNSVRSKFFVSYYILSISSFSSLGVVNSFTCGSSMNFVSFPMSSLCFTTFLISISLSLSIFSWIFFIDVPFSYNISSSTYPNPSFFIDLSLITSSLNSSSNIAFMAYFAACSCIPSSSSFTILIHSFFVYMAFFLGTMNVYVFFISTLDS